MRRKVDNSLHKRVFTLFVFFFLWMLFIFGSLVRVQVFNYGKNVARVQAQSNRTFTMNPQRGTIYDSKGDVLAISVKAKSAFLSNKNSVHSMALFNSVRKRASFTWKQVKDIRNRIRKGDKFIWLKRKLSDAEHERLEVLKEKNHSESDIDFIEEYKRIYPNGSTASHILGGVGVDEQGLAGIEYQFDGTIKGRSGKARVLRDARRRAFSLEVLTPARPGKDVYLTIDSSIQFFVEKELQKHVKKFKAKGGTVVVLDAREGAVLAMASYPNYPPDKFGRIAAGLTRNRAVSFNYHPGSTFKVVLGSIALEKNVCSPQREFNCHNGRYKVRDRVITDVHPYSKLSFEGIIVHSSNIGAAKIGERIGKKRLFNGVKAFGFGRRSGIQLPGEEAGILNPIKKWSGVSLAFLSYGYEMAVTPLQMARAFNVVASGGYLMKPYLLNKIDGVFYNPGEHEKILSRGTVTRMTAIMKEVVDAGTGKAARVAGIDIAGKTGTSKKIRKIRKYVSSFGGFFPAENPRVTMFVVIDEPKGVYYGGDVAAPLFRSIAERLLIYLRIFPELDRRNSIRL